MRMHLSEDSLHAAYLAVLNFLDSQETGSEACIILDRDLTPVDCGFQNPPDDEDRISVEQMRKDKEKPHDWVIKPGRYQIVQFSETPDENSIEGELSVYLASGSTSNAYLRMIKENALVVTVQVFWSDQ
jgi:hypothetical protein